jgi:signal transduction histidine kinase
VSRDYAAAPPLDEPAPHPILICIYRFVQEALMNGFRHAGGIGQQVGCDVAGDRLTVVVSDRGPGFDANCTAEHGLGLLGLRERIESIGGEFRVESSRDHGTRLTLTIGNETWA